MKKYSLTLLVWGLFLSTGFSQDDIPDSSGYSGYVIFLPGYIQGATNFLYAGPPMIGEVGNKSVGSIFQSPEEKSSIAFGLAGELSHKFKNSRTQFFIGNRLEDILRLDVPFGVGLRQELPDKSILAGSFLFTPLELLMWSDPFVADEDREETYLAYPGVRIRWGRILRTGLEITLTGRRYVYDLEASGKSLIDEGSLPLSEQSKLIRNGNVLKAMVLYRIDLKNHRFEPAFRYVFDFRQGEAIAQSGYSLQLTYIARIKKQTILDFNLLYGQRAAGEVHPIYGKTLESDRFGAAFTTIVPFKKFDSSFLAVLFSLEYLYEDASIDFYDSSFSSVFLGLMWKHIRK